MFRTSLKGDHGIVIEESLGILRRRFARDAEIEGYRKDGPVAVARFELGEDDESNQREARILRQREVSDVIERLLGLLGRASTGGTATR